MLPLADTGMYPYQKVKVAKRLTPWKCIISKLALCSNRVAVSADLEQTQQFVILAPKLTPSFRDTCRARQSLIFLFGAIYEARVLGTLCFFQL